jgi:hypothetical protein
MIVLLKNPRAIPAEGDLPVSTQSQDPASPIKGRRCPTTAIKVEMVIAAGFEEIPLAGYLTV